MAARVGHAVITGPDEAVTLAWRPLTHDLCWRPLLATSLGNLSLTHDLSLIHDPNTPKKIGDASIPMGDHDDSTEIQQNLEEYEGQLVELRALLKESDEDAADEIQAVIKDLEEAVELSKELLETVKQAGEMARRLIRPPNPRLLDGQERGLRPPSPRRRKSRPRPSWAPR